MKHTAAFLRAVGLVALVGYLACALTPLPNLLARQLAESEVNVPAQAIVVLGSDVRPDGTLGDASLRRTIVGIQQFRDGVAPLIIFLGSSRAGAISEAAVRASLGRDLGIPGDAILTDDRGLTTGEEAIRVKALLEPRHIRTILLVTDALHGARARYVFEREGFDVGFVAANSITQDANTPEERLDLTRFIAQQAVALLVYRVRG